MELRDALLKRDPKTAEKLVADAFVQVVPDGIGSKATLLNYLRTEPADPTLTLTTEDVQVRITGETAIVVGKRVERRRSPDNNREGVAYARYTRTYIKQQVFGGFYQNICNRSLRSVAQFKLIQRFLTTTSASTTVQYSLSASPERANGC